MDTTRQVASKAGLWYFVMSLLAVPGLTYIPGKLIVRGDATATAAHIRAMEMLLRLGMASELSHQVLGIYLVMALYRLFKPVDRDQARMIVILGALVSVPIMFVNVLNAEAALLLAKGAPYLAAIDAPQRDALAYMFMKLHGDGFTVASIFWALWLFPFGVCVIKSGFIPKWIGYALFVAGAGYLVDATIWCLAPKLAHPLGLYTTIMEIGELPVIFWLLIWGANGPRALEPHGVSLAPSAAVS